jgi:hypothetical protein
LLNKPGSDRRLTLDLREQLSRFKNTVNGPINFDGKPVKRLKKRFLTIGFRDTRISSAEGAGKG